MLVESSLNIQTLLSAKTRSEMWAQFLIKADIRRMAEIGVYRGEFAAAMLKACPSIERYYLIDPWQHLDDWNKPVNLNTGSFDAVYDAAMANTAVFASKRIILRGCTSEVIDCIPDESLDFLYIDGDHTLRGIIIDLVNAYRKLKPAGWLGGDDFVSSIWQHPMRFEPTLVFPAVVHFAEAVGAPLHALPHRQFLMRKNSRRDFSFTDWVGTYSNTALLPQVRPRNMLAHILGNRFRKGARALMNVTRRR